MLKLSGARVHWILFLMVIGPFLVLAAFCHPSSDDYSYAVGLINETHHYIQPSTFINKETEWLSNWSGRYFSVTLLNIIAPLIRWPVIYKLLSVIFILAFYRNVFAGMKMIFKTAPEKLVHLISIGFIACYFIWMPGTSEGIYWMAGSITYQLPVILTLFWLNRARRKSENHEAKGKIIDILLIVMIAGSNEMSMLMLLFFFVLILGYRLTFKLKIEKWLLAEFLVACLCTVAVLRMPGNRSRYDFIGKNIGVAVAFQQTFGAFLLYLKIWLPVVIAVSVLLYAVIRSGKIQLPALVIFNKVGGWIPFVILFLLTFILFFSSYYLGTAFPPKRVVNLIYIFFLSGWFLSLVNLLTLSVKKQHSLQLLKITGIAAVGILIVLLALPNNLRTAYGDLIKGRACQFNEQMNERYEQLHNCKNDSCFLKPIEHMPGVIAINDMTDDVSNWRNESQAIFFDCKAIGVTGNQ